MGTPAVPHAEYVARSLRPGRIGHPRGSRSRTAGRPSFALEHRFPFREKRRGPLLEVLAVERLQDELLYMLTVHRLYPLVMVERTENGLVPLEGQGRVPGDLRCKSKGELLKLRLR